MGLTQRLDHQITPAGNEWREASLAERRWFFDQAGSVCLERLKIQLSRGIGANGRMMRPRRQAVIPSGDGPVMEPRYDNSRVITLSDYMATDRYVNIFWQAGTGHSSHRAAREKVSRSFAGKGKAGKSKGRGERALPFGEILEFHQKGLVRGAPVRDVRLSAASIREVKKVMAQKWADRIKARKSRKPTPPRPQPQPAATPVVPPWKRLPAAAKAPQPVLHAVPLPSFGRQARPEV